jgi:hypothetical protein
MHPNQSSHRKQPNHQELAKIFSEDPKLVHLVAKRLLAEIKRLNSIATSLEQYWEWYAILTLWPLPEIIRLLQNGDEEGLRLREASPLLDLLTRQERSRCRRMAVS